MVYTIGEVAREVGMTVEGLRFYERRGLLRPARRTSAGYRLYEEAQLETLQFVRAAQRMGFSLAEIQELVELRGGGGPCSQVRDRLEEKLTRVSDQRRLLDTFEAQLRTAIDRCDEQLRSEDQDGCPVLAGLGADLDTPRDR